MSYYRYTPSLDNIRPLILALVRIRRWGALGSRLHRIGAERDARQAILQGDGGEVVNLSTVDLIHRHLRCLVHLSARRW